MAKQHRSLD